LPVCAITLNQPTTFNISASATTVTVTGTAATIPCDFSTRYLTCTSFIGSGGVGMGGASVQFNLTVAANTGPSRGCTTQITSNTNGTVWGTVQINQAAGP
jgi:hypothetical protein